MGAMRAPLLIVSLIAFSLTAQTPKPDRWGPLAFLIGEWTGEGGSGPGQGSGRGPGQGSGGFSFLPEQNGTVLVRKNRADYPAAKDRPAFSHTDLMIVYKEDGDAKFRAIYFDSEDHVIHYVVEAAGDGKSVRFLSENYRLTYTKTGADAVAIKFEIAADEQPGVFRTYIQASARRVRSGPASP